MTFTSGSESENRRSSRFLHGVSVEVIVSGSVDTTVVFFSSLPGPCLVFVSLLWLLPLLLIEFLADNPSLGVLYCYICSTIFNGRITWSWSAFLVCLRSSSNILVCIVPWQRCGIFIFAVLVPPVQVFLSSFFIFSSYTQFWYVSAPQTAGALISTSLKPSCNSCSRMSWVSLDICSLP